MACTSKRSTSPSAGRLIPDTPYVITLDADSLLQPAMPRTLVRLMEQPEHARTAVAQTPYSAIPQSARHPWNGPRSATTDIQYLVHQGFTRLWSDVLGWSQRLLKKIGLRRNLHGGTRGRERRSGGTFKTEPSSKIQNRPSISCPRDGHCITTPNGSPTAPRRPDFGSLVIQRARWANGGLIIFPKLLSFLCRAPKQPQTLVQALLQTLLNP